MSENVLISVIIPVFNREKLIVRAINSVLKQTYQYFELIILDDGSTDSTESVVKSFLVDKRIRYVKQVNSGRPSLARNSAITLSKGELISFLDSDDTWVENKLEIQVELLHYATEQCIDLSIISGDYNCNINGQLNSQTFFQSNNVLRKLKNHTMKKLPNASIYEKNGFLDELYRRGFLSTQSNMVRSKFVKQLGGFDKELVFFEDTDLWLKLASLGQVALSHKVLATYYIHEDNITSGDPSKIYIDTVYK
ncbi:MAG: glycosyltransferase family 2 protein [Saccharospirillaceae bacterium]|nr:glycosyltransferase family 2 protein [Saccharospirillaceae bacterium]